MWAINRQETITEHPSEEDNESVSQNENCNQNNQNNQNQQNRRKNKIDMILDEHKEQKNDYNYLIKKGKSRGYSENLTKTRIIPSLIREGREIIRDIKETFSRSKNRNKSINSTDNRSSLYKIEEYGVDKNKPRVKESGSASKYKRSNSMNFMKVENYNYENISNDNEFPEFDLKNDQERDKNSYAQNLQNLSVQKIQEKKDSFIFSHNTNTNTNLPQLTKNREIDLLQFNSVKSMTNSEKIR
jgi:hypothetical protein